MLQPIRDFPHAPTQRSGTAVLSSVTLCALLANLRLSSGNHATQATPTFASCGPDFRRRRPGIELRRSGAGGEFDTSRRSAGASETWSTSSASPLFHRFNRRVELTSSGARFLDVAGRAIDLIERECAALRPRRDGGTLRISVLQSFASTWLMPRLAAFRRRRPDIEVQIETSAELVDLISGPFDAAICFGNGHWPGLSATCLFETRAFAVAAPAHWPCGGMASAAAFDRTTLLSVVHMPDLWPQYLAGLEWENIVHAVSRPSIMSRLCRKLPPTVWGSHSPCASWLRNYLLRDA